MSQSADQSMTWQVTAPARLHFGFMDWQRFGSVGLSLASPAYQICLTPHTRLQITLEENAQYTDDNLLSKAQAFVEAFDKHYKTQTLAIITIKQCIPRHSGLGSGTQLALAIGHLLCAAHGFDLDSARIAASLQRGQRSGIGVAAFDQGGFIVDAGKSHADDVPEVAQRLAWPAGWQVMLILDLSRTGLHGEQERSAFDDLKNRQDTQESLQLKTIIHQQMLPAVERADYDAFAQSLNTFQQKMGQKFSAFQGGKYAHSVIGSILDDLSAAGVQALGQSSWGPTAYVIAENREHATELAGLVDAMRQRCAAPEAIGVIDAAVNHRGGEIKALA